MSRSLEAEQHLIACALIDSAKVPELLEIQEEWFENNAHKLIYRTIGELARDSLDTDFFAVADRLTQQRKIEHVGGIEYLNELAESLPNLKFWNSYKNSLFGYYKMRQIKNVADSMQMQLGIGAKPDEIVQYMQTSLIELLTDHHKGGLRPISKFLTEALDDIEWRNENQGKMRGHETGFKQLDEFVDGFEPGKVYVIAGRPAMGKTQFGLNICLRLSRNKPVCVFSLEMTGKGLSMRAICNESRVYNSKIKSGKLTDNDFNEIAMAVTRLHHNAKLFIDESPGLSIAQMRSRLKAFELAHGEIGAIAFDHIGLIKKDSRKSDTESMTAIVHELARLAKDFNAPVIELAQLNRGVESRNDKRPMLSDLKQSGAIEEDARVVMFLYRDEYYNPETTQQPNITELIIAKNSDGETKTIYFEHNMAIAHYQEIKDYEQPDPGQKKNIF